MRRREFLSALGGAAAWPVAAGAQQGERKRRVAFLHGLAENDQEALARVAAFREGTRDARLDRESQHHNRTSVLRRRYRTNPSSCEGTGRLAARRYRRWRHSGHCRAEASDTHHPDRLLSGQRSGRTGLRRQLGAAGRQHHRLHIHRLSHDRKVA